MKLLRTIRFDGSDERVFESAAGPGEWAVSGAFAFLDGEGRVDAPEALAGKRRQAFANGFLGVSTFGWSTFATVAEASVSDRGEVETRLADHFVECYGAPDAASARPAAQEEIEFIADLVREAPVNAVFTVRRVIGEDGRVREEFRIIRAPEGEPRHARIWTADDDGP
jgi:hypothetical protein